MIWTFLDYVVMIVARAKHSFEHWTQRICNFNSPILEYLQTKLYQMKQIHCFVKFLFSWNYYSKLGVKMSLFINLNGICKMDTSIHLAAGSVCVNSYKFLGRKTIIHIHSLLKQLVQFQFMASVIFFRTFMGLCFQVQRHEDTFCMVVTVIAVKVRLFPMWLSLKHIQKIWHKLVGRFFLCSLFSNNLIISK